MRRTIDRRKYLIPEVLKKHIFNNIKEYIIVSILLLIGVIGGVVFINNTSDTQKSSINDYINNYVETLKNEDKTNSDILFKKSITKNLVILLLMWFTGSTIIGIPIVLGLVIFKGFCLSYTISSFIISLGKWRGLAISIFAILPHSIITIPIILALSVTGIRLYKTIIKDKDIKKLKYEIIRHTVFCLTMLILLVFSSLIESFVSVTLLKTLIKYI